MQEIEIHKAEERLFRIGQSIWRQFDTGILILASIVFVGASIMGFPTADYLGPTVVALLGAIAFSQLRSRNQVKKVTDTWHRKRTDIFSNDFPHEYYEAQKDISKSYFYTGQTMGRTMPTMRSHIRRVLDNGGSARILLPNPDNAGLMEAIAKTHSDETDETIKDAIETSFRQAQACRTENNAIELRTTDVMPYIGINGLDTGKPSGKIVVQMYEHKPEEYSERAPIFLLEANDGEWFNHFRRQIDRLWADGKPYGSAVAPE